MTVWFGQGAASMTACQNADAGQFKCCRLMPHQGWWGIHRMDALSDILSGELFPEIILTHQRVGVEFVGAARCQDFSVSHDVGAVNNF